MLKKNFSKIKKERNFIKSNKSPFNSKLFLDIDASLNDALTDEFESNDTFNSKEFEIKDNNDYFILNELFNELDASCSNQEETSKNDINYSYSINNSNLLINYNYINPYNNLNNTHFPPRFNNINVKNFRDKSGDWICGYCKNLNFSFRKICNRCNIPKSKAVKKRKNFKIFNLN